MWDILQITLGGFSDGWTRPGKRTKSYGKSTISMGKSTISMAIFNSYVAVYQRLPEIWAPGPSTSHWRTGIFPLNFPNLPFLVVKNGENPWQLQQRGYFHHFYWLNISSAVVESLFVHWCQWLNPESSWFIQKLHPAMCAGQFSHDF